LSSVSVDILDTKRSYEYIIMICVNHLYYLNIYLFIYLSLCRSTPSTLGMVSVRKLYLVGTYFVGSGDPVGNFRNKLITAI